MSVGIVIVGFRCGPHLEETITSLRRQQDRDWRCAVVYQAEEHGHSIGALTQNDARFTLVESRLINVCAARNGGYSKINGELLFALDGDDQIEPHYISTLRTLMKRPQVRIAYTGTRYFGNFCGIKQELPYSSRTLAIRNTIVSAAMIRREHFEAVGGYDEHLATAYEDWDLWISLLKQGGEVAFDPHPYFLYRQRQGSRSHMLSYELATEAKEYIFRKHSDFCWHSPR